MKSGLFSSVMTVLTVERLTLAQCILHFGNGCSCALVVSAMTVSGCNVNPVSGTSAVIVTAVMTNLNFCDLWSFPSASTSGCLSSSDSWQIIQQISLVSPGVLSPKGHHSLPLCCTYHSEKLAGCLAIVHSSRDRCYRGINLWGWSIGEQHPKNW